MAKARERWAILKQAILSASSKQSSMPLPSASVRSFSSFELFSVESSDGWFHYSTKEHTQAKAAANICLPSGSTSLQDMMGFNNTGNVCIWPSEEALAHYCLTHAHLFTGSRVCELGCGSSALAGILLASTGEPTEALLTDGNRSSIENVSKIIDSNSFGVTKVTCQVLRWDDSFLKVPTLHDGDVDWIICADCLFFTELHDNLVLSMLKLLKPDGHVIMLAPGRSGTLEQFVQKAASKFSIERIEQYDEVIWTKHTKLLSCAEYKKDLHYPMLLYMTRLSS